MVLNRKMIINEKYIRDIDDEDDDFDDGMSQTRHISDKTMFEHYVTVSIENTYFKVQPSKFMFNRRLQ